jgi:sigma-B regulation protein RsbU (phosphoserine phosphatase)
VAEGRGLIANSGMPFPYLARGGELRQVAVAGIPLGLMEARTYKEAELHFEKGDTLFLISDGIIDAMNPEGDMYDSDRLAHSIQSSIYGDISECVRNLYQAVSEFIRNAEAHDDITIIGLRRLA